METVRRWVKSVVKKSGMQGAGGRVQVIKSLTLLLKDKYSYSFGIQFLFCIFAV